MVVQSACSTSLLAIHCASRAVLSAECNIALAGGISIGLPKKNGYFHQEGMIASSDGHCRAFDAKANGSIEGNGAGIVVLKRLKNALADGDHIYAVVKGSAINNDGKRKVGFTAPSVEGQAEVTRTALAMARVEPESIQYVETHGTGTPLGDPVEIEGLKLAFNTGKKHFCSIGSVKSNLGHLDAAAGAAGFIKTVLALTYQLIPPSLHFETPNPKINFENSPFYVNTQLSEWKNNGYPVRAGVSSLGIGGTNVHVVLEEAPRSADLEAETTARQRPRQLILLSARTGTALDQASQNLANHFKKNPGINLADAAYTLQKGRKAFEYRKLLICSDTQEVTRELSSLNSPKVKTFHVKVDKRPVIFMFSGLGSQYVDMGLGLYQEEPLFREEMDRCFYILKPLVNEDIKEILYPGHWLRELNKEADNPGKINRIEITQLVVFIFEYALAKLLMNWGLKPDAMIGYSFGEYAAACISGVLSLEDALELLVYRGELMKRLSPGAMLSVPLTKEEIVPLLSRDLSIAVDNGPSCIVAGPPEAVKVFENQMKEKKLMAVRLQASRAVHSRMMEPIQKEFEQKVGQFKLKEPHIPYISNVTGNWTAVQEAKTPAYWARHLRETVQFAAGIKKLVERKNAVFVEIGPGRDLCTLITRYIDSQSNQQVTPLVREPTKNIPDELFLLNRIGTLWLWGVEIDWDNFHDGEKKRRIPLPSYPFERRRYWIEGNLLNIGTKILEENLLLRRKADIADWFYIPSWKRSQYSAGQPVNIGSALCWLVFTNKNTWENRLLEKLEEAQQTIITVEVGDKYQKVNNHRFIINPGSGRDSGCDDLFNELDRMEMLPDKVLHLWSITIDNTNHLPLSRVNKAQDLGFYSLINIARGIGRRNVNKDIQIIGVTNNMQEVTGDDLRCPEKITVLGPLGVIPIEYDNIRCCSIDVVLAEPGTPGEARLADRLLEEIMSGSPDPVTALRGEHRWIRTFEPIPLESTKGKPIPLNQEGVYLVTGGLGGIGLTLAEYLARNFKAKLILTGRSKLPHRENRDEWLADDDKDKALIDKIRTLKELEELGAEVHFFSADVSNREQMHQAVTMAIEKFNHINGVIHAAGLPDGEMIQGRTRESSQRILLPKINGTLVLMEVLKDVEPDFIIFCSSMNSVVNAIGQAAYCSANAFMDTFAIHHFHKNKKKTKIISIGWDRWQNVGMAVAGEKLYKELTGEDLTGGITLEEGIEIFERILGGINPHVIISNRDLERVIEQSNQFRASAAAGTFEETASPKNLLPRPDLGTPYMAPRNKLEQILVDTWQNFFGIEQIGISDDFFELGGDSLKGMRFVNKYQDILKEIVHINVVFDAPTIEELVDYFNEHYPQAVKRIIGIETEDRTEAAITKIDEGTIREFRRLITPPPPQPKVETRKNPPAIFVLCCPRSGSTLLRVILGGHPRLFAPPELNLLTFGYLNEMVNSEQGIIRAIMQMKELSVEEAKSLFQDLQQQKITTKQFYGLMQDWLGDRILVDKSPDYSRTVEVLKRTGEYFENPLYIHLVRHPYGMIRSFEEAKMDLRLGSQVLKALAINRLQFAEVDWTISQQNILEFLENVPRHRKHLVRFEDLAKQSQVAVEGICQFLGLEPHPEMLQPYKDKKERMTDGIYKEGIMIGDVKFHTHKKINKNVADTWKSRFKTDFLSDLTWEIAEFFGYERLKENKTTYSSVEPGERKEYYAMSSAQKRLYILHHMNPDSTAYNMQQMFTLKGTLEKEKLEKVFYNLIKRHESLRTSFITLAEEPLQRVQKNVNFGIEYYDISKVKNGDKDGRETCSIDEIITHLVRPFHLAQAPLLRVGLIKVEEENHILVAEMHHIVSDGVSNKVLVQDFMVLYTGKELSPLRLQYKDYSEWQQSRAVVEALEKQEEYWLKEFQGEIPVLSIPTDYPRPALQSFEGKVINFQLRGENTKALNDMARSQGATLFMVLLTVYNIFLSRLSNQEDIIVGIPIANRNHADLEGIIGIFVNTLALRNYPAGKKQFISLLKEVKERTLEAFKNQSYQFEDLVGKVVHKRDMSHNPLFNMTFRLENIFGAPAPKEILGQGKEGLKLESYSYEQRTTKFDLSLVAVEREENVYLSFEYCTRLFNQKNILRFITFFNNIISSVVKTPGIKISEIEIITGEEKKQILYGFNDTRTEYPANKFIHELFAEQAAKIPDNIAVAAPQNGENPNLQYITYKELNQKSEQLAHLLQSQGAASGSLAAVMMNHCADMITGLLAILKTGGTYLPIDPGYPEERIRYMLSDSRASMLLTTPGLSGQLEKLSIVNCQLLMVNENSPGRRRLNTPPKEANSINNYQLTINNLQLEPANLAYVIYTSGSTGKPKGVLVTHRNVARLVKNPTYINLSEGDRLMLTGNIVFDITTFEIWGPLLNGLALYLFDQAVILDANKLKHTLRKSRINILHLVPQLFNQLASEDLEIFAGLSYLLVGGDMVQPEYMNEVKNRFNDLDILHMYGPTENTTFSTYYLMDKTVEASIPIGKPIGNSTVYILDRQAQLLPIGVVGELYTGGDGVARGYLNNPELTNDKFLNSPFTLHPSLLYKTGDLARWLPDGNIEFLGRSDEQVKIRGMRIELGEIENSLLRNDAIKQTVVAAATDDKGEKYLCAYVVSNPSMAGPELREYLAKALPDYMIPAYFVQMEQIPLTPNGKTDRKALPKPEKKAGEGYIAPRNEVEEKLAEIWADVLNIDKEIIGIESNFFELGGHSLKAVLAVSRIKKMFNVHVPLAKIFKTPGITGISQYIKNAGELAQDWFASLEPVEKKEYYPLSPAQKRLYILHQMDTDSIAYNMSRIMVMEEEPYVKKLEATFRKLIERHESLRTSFEEIEGNPVQRVHPPGEIEFEIVHNEPGNVNPSPIINNFIRPFDLSQAPLLKVGMLKTTDGKHILMVDMHHIISDGVSHNVLAQDFRDLYLDKKSPVLRLQYKDYSEWRKKEEEKGTIKKQQAFWLKHFESNVPVLNLPVDYTRPAVQGFEGDAVDFEIGIEETKALYQITRTRGVTLFMLVLSIYNVLLAKISGQEEIVIGSPVAGRRHPDLEIIIGVFINTVALRNHPQKQKTFLEFLEEVKENTLNAFENQDYQFENLVDAVVKSRDISRNPLFDVSFNFQNLGEANMGTGNLEKSSAGLKMTRYEYKSKTSKFDLDLRTAEADGKLFFKLEYITKLFKKKKIELFINYFKEITTSVISDPGKKISGIGSEYKGEREKFLSQFSDDLENE